ncbi:MAG: hypothetical protein WCL13_04275, partial [bacterium]
MNKFLEFLKPTKLKVLISVILWFFSIIFLLTGGGLGEVGGGVSDWVKTIIDFIYLNQFVGSVLVFFLASIIFIVIY